MGVAGGVAPIQIYKSYDVAVAALFHARLAVVCVARVLLSAGAVLVTQAGTGMLAVVKLVLLEEQPVAGPVAFLGTTYQLYKVPATRPAAA